MKIEWWSARRGLYNVTLLIAASISVISLFVVSGLFSERLPCREFPTIFSMFISAPFFFALANACYSLGSLSERLIRPRNVMAFRNWLYRAGVAFSLLLIFEPPIFNLAAALFDPMP